MNLKVNTDKYTAMVRFRDVFMWQVVNYFSRPSFLATIEDCIRYIQKNKATNSIELPIEEIIEEWEKYGHV